MAPSFNYTTVAGTLGLTFSAIFLGANLGISYITVPTLLLSSPPSPLPPPANAPNAASLTSAASEKPVTKASHLARQWQHVYNIGKKAGPVAALLASASFLFAFRNLPVAATRQRRLFLAATGLCLSIVPFTFTAMKCTNGELTRRATAATRGEEDDAKFDARAGTVESYQTHDLLNWWATLNTL
ncbi:hypothetical protein A1O1_03060 [Capronia coronata CBS 617.96]|uniref:Uncharacterized protein n=1 Tax=Capronia coronata CBS 617.96 TaxID=1182541 RepID=W9YQ19_9EURO|nr:uncharacterized protein A1O1_03060 [Capronia coronata CBS 617.96]EXJ94663.1 hypothetical protein A1O1_03060 [Capronia coronata CBS 617.96]